MEKVRPNARRPADLRGDGSAAASFVIRAQPGDLRVPRAAAWHLSPLPAVTCAKACLGLRSGASAGALLAGAPEGARSTTWRR